MRTYTGLITKLEPHQIFVFGSNIQGRHGKGAALWALRNAGAIYGQAKGRQGQSYAIVTKDLQKWSRLNGANVPTIAPFDIVMQIDEFYDYTLVNPELDFLVAYSGTGTNLNYYSNEDMAHFFSLTMFNRVKMIPDNVVFEEQFAKLINQFLCA